MHVPFFDIGRLNATVASQLHAAATRAISSGWYILGKECSEFELSLVRQLAGKYVAGCNSGTDALVLSLLASGVGVGDEVITVANTAIPTVSAICSTGALPVFVDIDSDTWLMNAGQITSAISPRTKAIIAVHLYGNVVDIFSIKQELKEIGREDVVVIEDVAQAHGASLGGSSAGTIGHFGAFSFYPSKNIGALGDGGAVHCLTEANFHAIISLRNYGQKDRYNAEQERGINSRLDEVQAAMLSVKLPFLEEWNAKKQEVMDVYRSELAHLPIAFQAATVGAKPGWHLCVIATENETTRNNLQGWLSSNGIQTLIHYPIPCHLQPAFRSSRHERLHVTESLSKKIISMPFSPVLTQDEQWHVINAISGFYR